MEKNNTETLKEHAGHDQTVMENCHGGQHTLPFKNPSFPSDTEVHISLADHAHPWKSGLWDTWLQAPISGPDLHFVQHWAVSGESSPRAGFTTSFRFSRMSETLHVRIPGCQSPWMSESLASPPRSPPALPSQEPGL